MIYNKRYISGDLRDTKEEANMAPKKKYSKEKIIDSAFEVARIEGIDSITIRKVAEKMGSSIAPIYVNFKDIDELKQAVINKIFDIRQQLLMERYTENRFLDIGIASLRFAKEYSVLFRDLVMKNNNYMKDYEQKMGNVLEEMKKDPELDGFTDEELMSLLLKMRIFQLGLSVMVANGLLPEDFNEERVIEILKSNGADVIIATRLRKKLTLE